MGVYFRSVTKTKSVLLLLLVATLSPCLARSNSGTSAETIACRAIEAEVATRFAVSLVVFHYRGTADRDRLGQLLRKYDGGNVQFKTHGGPWRPATVLRLKTCFGRGLLVFSVSGPKLARGDEFMIEFPSHSAK
jgi:hypothetical protein